MTEDFPHISYPDCPIVTWRNATLTMMTRDGELEQYQWTTIASALYAEDSVPLVCHAPTLWRKSDIQPSPVYDLLELFAFACPARFCLPTLSGLAEALDLPSDPSNDDGPLLALQITTTLLQNIAHSADAEYLRALAMTMGKGGWLWAPFILQALGHDHEDDVAQMRPRALDVWKSLPEWQEEAPPPPAGSEPVNPTEARQRLSELLGHHSENRPSQSDFASAISSAFDNPPPFEIPRFLLAEAGTGVGKTLGYLAPASLWAEKNEAPVWISTYTRNLQHQIDDELNRLYPDPVEKRQRVVLRKGRENYICLLNYEDAVKFAATNPSDFIGLGLMARWIAHSRDGDLSGGDFPSWLSDLVGHRRTVGLSDRRGECIYTSCSHYNRCFIEQNIRRSRKADIVIANHALVMIQSARGTLDPQGRVSRLVFDEGHHVFDAADSAFSAYLSGHEMAELRRWLRGTETGSRGRIKGLKSRIEDLLGEDEKNQHALEALLQAATSLASEGWATRITNGRFDNIGEQFLLSVGELVYARSSDTKTSFNLEIEAHDPDASFLESSTHLREALDTILAPSKALRKGLNARLDQETDSLDSQTRNRIEIITRSLLHRCEMTVKAWIGMLDALNGPADIPPKTRSTPSEDNDEGGSQKDDQHRSTFVDWFSVERQDGRDVDVGLKRHWLDPSFPFAETVIAPSIGTVITSATLTDSSGSNETDWRNAEMRTGARFLPTETIRAKVPSPFDYANQTRVFLVTDVNRNDLQQISAAFRELMLASEGGALGLFTAITRLKSVYKALNGPLEEKGYPLYAQHIDALNLPTLIDIFKAETHSCLLGTDAVRDGVDVPGDSLRMLIFDRTPWPRPQLLHKARREAFGKRFYDESLTRLKVKQAFGRLVRRQSDHGVFVMLDNQFPSKLHSAFPKDVQIERIGIAETIAKTKAFFQTLKDQTTP